MKKDSTLDQLNRLYVRAMGRTPDGVASLPQAVRDFRDMVHFHAPHLLELALGAEAARTEAEAARQAADDRLWDAAELLCEVLSETLGDLPDGSDWWVNGEDYETPEAHARALIRAVLAAHKVKGFADGDQPDGRPQP